MKLKDYLYDLNVIVEDNPNLLDMEVVTACDDEGNSFDRVAFSPSEGYFDVEEHAFTQKDSEDFDECECTVNSVCLN